MNLFSEDLIWWISVVDIPAMGGLFWLIWRVRRDGERGADHLRDLLERRSSQLREGLHAFKLEVAKNYASHNDLRELEERLTQHLLRIESKLDRTALKAEAAASEKR